MQRTCTSRRNTGVTLVELMIVIVIAAILASIAAPSLASMIRDMRLSSASSQLFGDLNMAKSEAIKRNARVLVCANPGGANPTACAATTNWANGWLICADADGNGCCDDSTPDNPNPIVVRGAIHTTLVLSVSAVPAIFNPNGTAVANSLGMTGNWSTPATRTNTIEVTGNIRSTKTP